VSPGVFYSSSTDAGLNGGSKLALKSIKALCCQKQPHEATIIKTP